MTNDEIRNLIATLEREAQRTTERFAIEDDRDRARELYGRVCGIEYAIGAIGACIRDE
jgi:hypothetical protein